jgi:hypothetical protein
MTSQIRDPWVDRRVTQVRATAAAEYLRRHGWDPVPSSNENVQMFAGPRADSGQRITQPVPLREDADDYVRGIIRLITNVAVLEDRLAVDVLNEMLGVTTPSANGAPTNKAPDAAPAPTA